MTEIHSQYSSVGIPDDENLEYFFSVMRSRRSNKHHEIEHFKQQQSSKELEFFHSHSITMSVEQQYELNDLGRKKRKVEILWEKDKLYERIIQTIIKEITAGMRFWIEDVLIFVFDSRNSECKKGETDMG